MNRRRSFMTTKTVLPPAYIALDYIESTGQQYLDIDYICEDDLTPYRIETVFRLTSLDYSSFLFGTARTTGNNYAHSFGYDSEEGKYMAVRAGGEAYRSPRFGIPDFNIHTFVYEWKNGFFLDGSYIDECSEYVSREDVASGTKLGICCRIRANTNVDAYFRGQLFSFKIYGRHGLERDLVPCMRRADKVIGMYDTVNNMFYNSASSKNFLGG